MAPRSGDARRGWTVALGAMALALTLGTLAAVIAGSQQQSRSQLLENLRLRTLSSANLVGTYVSQQAYREQALARRYLSSSPVSRERFETVAYAFGSRAAVLADAEGRVLAVLPADPTLVGRRLTQRYPAAGTAAAATESGSVAVSNVVDAARGVGPVAAIAVPFQAISAGRRVFAAAYPVGGAQLDAFVDHAISYSPHRVLLADSSGKLLAASPRTTGSTLAGDDPALARALARGSSGAVPGAASPSSFAAAPIPGTTWRMVVMVSDAKLYASVSGLAAFAPWLVFALVTLLGVLLLGVFARLLADRARLAQLTRELADIARTDPLTGLLNRRGMDESLRRAAALSRRRGEPMSVLMIDLDGFKEVNDRHGHAAGDRVLRALADCMRAEMRTEDVYGRVGGDEFMAVLIQGDEEAARSSAWRLESAAAATRLPGLDLGGGIALSIGIASGLYRSIEDLIGQADADLYRVKAQRHGRGGPPPGEPAGAAPSAAGGAPT